MTLTRHEFVQLAAAMGTSLAWGGSARASTTGSHERREPADTFAEFGSVDYGSSYHERGRIYDLVRDEDSVGFAIVSGDRHSFWAARRPGDEMRTEFVCMPRPIRRRDRPDGGPLRYGVIHTTSLWKPGERPLLHQQVIEATPAFRSETAPGRYPWVRVSPRRRWCRMRADRPSRASA